VCGTPWYLGCLASEAAIAYCLLPRTFCNASQVDASGLWLAAPPRPVRAERRVRFKKV